MSLLEDGLIPAGQECPFKDQCEVAIEGRCYHNGKDHTVAFSCGLARAFEIIFRNQYEKEEANV
jgi:hypothetical protein